MGSVPKKRRWRGPPLALQILALLIGGLVVAQFVTLLLTMLLPPAPPSQYGLDEIAAALRGGTAAGDDRRHLQRIVQPGPPNLAGPGWLVSERSRADLSRLLGVDPADVSLAFYTPLPFAGAAVPPPMPLLADDGPLRPAAELSMEGDGRQGRLILAQAIVSPRTGMNAGQPLFGTLPRLGPPPRDMLPPGVLPGGALRGDLPQRLHPILPRDGAPREATPRGAERLPHWGGNGLYTIDPTPPQDGRGGIYIPGDGGAAVPPLLQGRPPVVTQPETPSGNVLGRPGGTLPEGFPPGLREREPGRLRPFLGGAAERAIILQQPALALPLTPPIVPPSSGPALTAPMTPAPAHAPERHDPPPHPVTAGTRTITVPQITLPAAAPLPSRPPAAPPAPPHEQPAGPPIAVAAPPRGLFGLAPAPFVEGDFVAALRLADGRWSVVQPAAEPFPNAWQRRLLLWFAIAFAIVAPLGWLFARRLVKPLGQFAAAAERLGRDPAATVIAGDGPAEIGRATHAFNLMQSRLRAFVNDRTAMIGAISHDLRTPLTRMRFRIEDVPDEAREGLLEEVEEMEAMITSVLEFIRDASSPGVRERIDLRTLVDDVVEDAVMVGNDVTVEQAQSATVEIDVLGMRRVLDNLVENAVKYGMRARVRVTADDADAIAEIIDDGPGLSDDELERVFEPFYRSDAARSSDKGGHGLGLAVCRSIARAHGGDVRLLRSPEGFLAQVRVPLAYRRERALAA